MFKMVRRKRKITRVVKRKKMAAPNFGKMEWELFILVIITLILAGAFFLF